MHLLVYLCIFVCAISHLFAEKTIGIFTCNCGVQPWDPDSIASGITGSEEAVIYLSQELAQLGYRVAVFANPPADSRYTSCEANPRFLGFEAEKDRQFDIAIAWRMPGAATALQSRAKQIYLWPHDTNHWPLTLAQIGGFTDVFWLSQWQRKQWVETNPAFAKFSQFFGNGIMPEQFNPVKTRDNPHSCIYGSNYARGLEILLDVWPEVKKQFPNATLDIYYGWQHWGLLSPAKEAKMRMQVASLAPLGVVDHGMVGHAELNRAYECASLWTYPCIAPETFCITALRAQMGGAIPVIIEGSALSETVRYGFKCQKAEEYLSTLLKALKAVETASVEERTAMREFVLREYTWKAIAQKWKKTFDSHNLEQVLLSSQ